VHVDHYTQTNIKLIRLQEQDDVILLQLWLLYYNTWPYILCLYCKTQTHWTSRKSLIFSRSVRFQRDVTLFIMVPRFHLAILDWVAQTSINIKSQLNLKCKLFSYTFHVNLSVK